MLVAMSLIQLRPLDYSSMNAQRFMIDVSVLIATKQPSERCSQFAKAFCIAGKSARDSLRGGSEAAALQPLCEATAALQDPPLVRSETQSAHVFERARLSSAAVEASESTG